MRRTLFPSQWPILTLLNLLREKGLLTSTSFQQFGKSWKTLYYLAGLIVVVLEIVFARRMPYIIELAVKAAGDIFSRGGGFFRKPEEMGRLFKKISVREISFSRTLSFVPPVHWLEL